MIISLQKAFTPSINERSKNMVKEYSNSGKVEDRLLRLGEDQKQRQEILREHKFREEIINQERQPFHPMINKGNIYYQSQQEDEVEWYERLYGFSKKY